MGLGDVQEVEIWEQAEGGEPQGQGPGQRQGRAEVEAEPRQAGWEVTDAARVTRAAGDADAAEGEERRRRGPARGAGGREQAAPRRPWGP